MATQTECKHTRTEVKWFAVAWGEIEVARCLDCTEVVSAYDGEFPISGKLWPNWLADDNDGSLDYTQCLPADSIENNGKGKLHGKKFRPVKEAITHPVAGRKIQAGSLCPVCKKALMCVNGFISYELKNYAAICNHCRVVLCATCGHKPHALGNGKYFCSRCNGGIEIVISFSLEAERIKLTVEEAHENGRPLAEHQLIVVAHQKLCQTRKLQRE